MKRIVVFVLALILFTVFQNCDPGNCHNCKIKIRIWNLQSNRVISSVSRLVGQATQRRKKGAEVARELFYLLQNVFIITLSKETH